MRGDNEEENGETMQRLQSSFGASSSSVHTPQLHAPPFRGQIHHLPPNSAVENSCKRIGIPPSHPQIPPISPYSQIRSGNQQNFSNNPSPSHARSLSQPPFSAVDSLPPLVPSHYRESPPTFISDQISRESLPPRNSHRRSNSDIPLGFSINSQSSPPLIPLGKSEGEEAMDELFSAYMNLDNINAFNENRDDLDSRASGTKTNGGDSSDNEATSSVKETGIKRNAEGDISSHSRHYRSLSMDSFMGNMNLADESPKMPPSPTDSLDANTNAFISEFGIGEFSSVELKKIMTNEMLSEIASSDPKRAKRILANRQSAARSKERKVRYITELEHKVHTLQTEATTLSTQLTMLQRDSSGINIQNNELKFRLQAMQQQAHLRDALNEALTSEVQRLKLATGEASKFQHFSISPRVFQPQE